MATLAAGRYATSASQPASIKEISTMRSTITVFRITSIAVGLVAANLFTISKAAAQEAVTCPCNFTAADRELSRKQMRCRSGQFGVAVYYPYAGVRQIEIDKVSRKAIDGYGEATKIFAIKDFAPTTGSTEFGDHFCEVASNPRKGVFRTVERGMITTIEEWQACLGDLETFAAAYANESSDPADWCADGEIYQEGNLVFTSEPNGTPDRLEYVNTYGGGYDEFPPPDLPSQDGG
jgi:hypothetical protein